MSRAGRYDNGNGNGKGNDMGNGGEGLWHDRVHSWLEKTAFPGAY